MKEGKYINLEDHMRQALINSKYVEHVMMSEMLDPVTKEKLLDLLIEPKDLKLTEDGLVYINKDGEECKCVNYGLNTTADGKWLSNKIQPVTFDIDQDGNLRKAEEAQAAYCLTTLFSSFHQE